VPILLDGCRDGAYAFHVFPADTRWRMTLSELMVWLYESSFVMICPPVISR